MLCNTFALPLLLSLLLSCLLVVLLLLFVIAVGDIVRDVRVLVFIFFLLIGVVSVFVVVPVVTVLVYCRSWSFCVCCSCSCCSYYCCHCSVLCLTGRILYFLISGKGNMLATFLCGTLPSRKKWKGGRLAMIFPFQYMPGQSEIEKHERIVQNRKSSLIGKGECLSFLFLSILNVSVPGGAYPSVKTRHSSDYNHCQSLCFHR